MRTLLKFLVGPRASWLPAALLLLWVAVILPAALWALGTFAAPGFDTMQQTALSRALAGGDPIAAIDAAKTVGIPFGTRVQEAIEESSATFDRGKMLAPSAVWLESGGTAGQGWVQRHVCGLEGWGEHRAVVRTLMLNGLGRCTDRARFWARSPILDGAPAIAGWLFFPLLLLLLVAPPLLVALLWKIRSAYQWLYSSSVIKPQPPQAAG